MNVLSQSSSCLFRLMKISCCTLSFPSGADTNVLSRELITFLWLINSYNNKHFHLGPLYIIMSLKDKFIRVAAELVLRRYIVFYIFLTAV